MATATIIGLGGLGCPAALGLAEGTHPASGAAVISKLVLIDDDRVALSNLQRQVLFRTSDIGRSKVDAARAALGQRFPELEVVTIDGRVDGDTVNDTLAGTDVIIDGTDDPDARFIINDWALKYKVPAVLGGILRFDGLVLAIAAGCGPCFRCLFEAPPGPGEVATCAQAGVLGALAGLVGHLQAERALAMLTGRAHQVTGYATTIDGLRGRVRNVPLPESTDCPACGGLAARLDITADSCPITYVRTKLTLDTIAPGALLEILMRVGEPSRNVPRSLIEDGHLVLVSGPVGPNLHRLVVRRAA